MIAATRRSTRTLVLVAAIALGAPPLAFAQPSPTLDGPTVRAGQRVRIDAPEMGARRLTGTIAETRGDTLSIRAEGTGFVWTIRAGAITSLHLSRGTRPRSRLVLRGALFGAALGGAIGAVYGANGRCWPTSHEWDTCGDTPRMIFEGARTVALLGALVGLTRPREVWEPTLGPVRVALGGAPSGRDGGWVVGTSLSF